MKRVVLLVSALAVVAAAYAMAGEDRRARLFELFQPSKRLPALRTTTMPFRYPAHLWRKGIEGEVLLRVHITETGAVDSVALESSSGHEELDRLALEAAPKLEYHPALQGEEAVAVWAILPVRFQRKRAEPR